MTHDIKHHLSDAVLMAYSAGTLPEAFDLIVATHISLCATCRAQAETFDAVGGEILDSGSTAEISSIGFQSTIDLIEGGAVARTRPVHGSPDGFFPKPLQDYVGGDLDCVNWKPVGMGVKQAILDTSDGATARLLYIPAGTAMPDHGHRGTEMTMVLKGAFQDDDGYFARGDVETADSDLHHKPVADIHEDCVCLAVTDAPLQFDRLVPRLAQRFLRI